MTRFHKGRGYMGPTPGRDPNRSVPYRYTFFVCTQISLVADQTCEKRGRNSYSLLFSCTHTSHS